MKWGVRVLLFLCLIAGMSYGKGGASVQGTISDATGAVLPGASVNVKNSGTGSSVDLVTDERGRYLAPVLQPGEYEIQASLPGFQTVSRRGIRLQRMADEQPNHSNFAAPSLRTAFTNASGVPSPTAGVISSTVTRPRQIQFGLKFMY